LGEHDEVHADWRERRGDDVGANLGMKMMMMTMVSCMSWLRKGRKVDNV
jgi:hypothetical protein